MGFYLLEGFFLMFRVLWIIVVCIFSSSGLCASKIVYLSWAGDPTTTMVVQWLGGKQHKESTLHLKTFGGLYEQSFQPEEVQIDGADTELNRVFLSGLEPDKEYVFTIGKGNTLYRFRTLPKTLEHRVHFVVGGDLYYHYNLFRKMNQAVATLSPDFVVLGGDIAYVYSHNPPLYRPRDWQWKRWHTFLESWHEQMIDQEGRLIPFLVVVGNHDVKHKAPGQEKNLFYTLFPWKKENQAYREVLFGDYLALFLLDSGHTDPIGGEQALWLEQALCSAKGVYYKMAVYHIPAYPSHSAYHSSTSSRIREAWCPLFDEYGVQVAFAHHSHTYKRTKPILKNQVDERGVIYLGDGSWGVIPRRVKTPSEEWYLEKTASVNAVYHVELFKEYTRIQAIGNTGKILDEVPLIFPRL